jgi:hypothetical protein
MIRDKDDDGVMARWVAKCTNSDYVDQRQGRGKTRCEHRFQKGGQDRISKTGMFFRGRLGSVIAEVAFGKGGICHLHFRRVHKQFEPRPIKSVFLNDPRQ